MLNKVTLIGRLTRDVEIRYMPSGEAVCNFGLATSETWKDKATGQKQEKVEFHNISMFGKLAEIAGQYLQKGSLVYLEGKIQSDKYTDKQGVERTAYKIICNEMKMLGGKSEHSGSHEPAENVPPQPPKPRQAAQPAQPIDDIDSDPPF